jgi:lysophospholipase L1-like esterase
MSQTTSRIEEVDRHFVPAETTPDAVWYDIRGFGVEGRGWSDVESFYDRLPARAKALVRPDVWLLSHDTAGLAARFVAETPSISARWTVRDVHGDLAMPHMPATGVSGLDLYGRVDSVWRHAANGRPTALTNSMALVRNTEAAPREWMIYLPLYNGVESVQIGLPPTAKLSPAPARPPGRDKSIVFYGTSVTQGGCASRPGMAFPAILGRWLERETINLGFSGNGRMEIEVARLLAEIDAAVFVIDCLGNIEAAQITERTEPLVRTLREAHPRVPIVLVDNVPYTSMTFDRTSAARFAASNAAQKAAFDRLTAAGVRGLHHVPSARLYGDDGEATVDGGHASDLGFLRYAEGLLPVLRRVLA